MNRNQPNASASASATGNSSVPARSYWTTQAGAPNSSGGAAAEPEVPHQGASSTTTTPKQSTLPPIVMQAVIGVNFIADHLKQQDEFNKVHDTTRVRRSSFDTQSPHRRHQLASVSFRQPFINTLLMMSHWLVHLPLSHRFCHPSRIHCFIPGNPGSKLTFSTNPFHHCLPALTAASY